MRPPWPGPSALPLVPLLALSAPAPAAEVPRCELTRSDDAVFLLTMTPGDDITTAFGHTGLAFHDPRRRLDSPVYDFGNFHIVWPDLLVDVLTATQDYWVARSTLGRFLARGQYLDTDVYMQELNLDAPQRRELRTHLEQALLPENRVFRYNWYRPNCTTEVQEALDLVLDGQLREQHAELGTASPASQVLRHAGLSTPLWFGLEWGSGKRARQPVPEWDAMYLPTTLMEGIEASEIRTADGTLEPLVLSTCLAIDGSLPGVLDEPPRRSGLLAGIGIVSSAALAGIGARSPRLGRPLILMLGVALALFGSAALLVGTLGTFAPFWGHHNLFYASPVSAALAVAAWIRMRHPSAPSPWPRRLAGAVAGLGLVGLVVGLFRGFADGNLGIALLIVPSLVASAWVLSGRDAA